MAEKLRAVKGIVDEFAPFVEAHKNMPMRAQTVAYGLAALIAIMRYLGVDKCVTSEADNMEGYLTLKGRA